MLTFRTDPALELDRVLDIIALEAKSAPGRAALLARAPQTAIAQCEILHRQNAEMVRYRRAEGAVPLSGLDDVRPTLSLPGLGLEESWNLLRAARATQAVREALLRVEGFPLLGGVAAGIADLQNLIASVGRFFTRDGKLREDASASLRTIRTRIQSKRNAIHKVLTDLMQRKAEAVQEPIVTLRGDRFCIPVRVDRRGEIPGILHERSGSGASLFVEPMAVVELNNDLADLLIDEREEIARITNHIAALFRAASAELIGAVDAAATVDALQCCAIFHERVEAASTLRFATTPELVLREARHPLIDERLHDQRKILFGEDRPRTVVPVSLAIGPQSRALVISGPNAGGKTVSLKTAGLLVAMAMSGLPVPAADGTVIPFVDRIHVLVGDDQAVLEQLSTFSAYLFRLKRILESATPSSLVLLDELGSGTDPEEGAALAAAILEELVARGCMTIATTHLSSLKTFAMHDDRVENASTEFDAVTGGPTFRLISGVPGRSRAIDAARSVGLPERIIAAARTRMGERYGEIDALLQQLQQRLTEAAADRLEAERLRADAAVRSAEIAAAAQRLKEEQKKLKRKAASELDEVKREVRQRLKMELESLREVDRAARDRLAASAVEKRVLEPVMQIAEAAAERHPVRIGEDAEHRTLGIRGRVLEIERGRATLAVGGKKMHVAVDDLSGIVAAAQRDARRTATPRPAEEPEEAVVGAELNLIGHRVEEALDESERFLDRSLLAGKSAVRLIHGHGTGTLKRAIREFLRRHPSVKSYRAGAENEGGDGATVVVLGE